MEINKDFVAKIKAATTPEEIVKIFTENGNPVAFEDAKSYIDLRAKYRNGMTDEELEEVAGVGFEHFPKAVCNSCGYEQIVFGEGMWFEQTCFRCGADNVSIYIGNILMR
ncbi:MAG: hypothetical protein LBM59_03400 [Ruminococcus sp.]|jgi:hypothetical protein|nr:hypothetical protein [Ruminococcus sp.]